MRASDAQLFSLKAPPALRELVLGGGGSCLDVAAASKARFTCCFDSFTRPNLGPSPLLVTQHFTAHQNRLTTQQVSWRSWSPPAGQTISHP